MTVVLVAWLAACGGSGPAVDAKPSRVAPAAVEASADAVRAETPSPVEAPPPVEKSAAPTCRPADARDPATPWRAGGPLVDGWTVEEVDADHAEFVRIFVTDASGARTGVEIKYRDGGEPGDWATAHYQLMPAPGQSPSEALLAAVRAELDAVEARWGGAPIRADDPYGGLPPCPP